VADTVVVFTAEGRDEIISNAGSQSWAISKDRARTHEFLVCVRNAKNLLTEGDEVHGSAFLIGRIVDVVTAPSPKRKHEIGRWMIKICDYADIDFPDVWKGWRNPIRYADLKDLGIELAQLRFTPV
jgi:hypothetical protein